MMPAHFSRQGDIHNYHDVICRLVLDPVRLVVAVIVSNKFQHIHEDAVESSYEYSVDGGKAHYYIPDYKIKRKNNQKTNHSVHGLSLQVAAVFQRQVSAGGAP